MLSIITDILSCFMYFLINRIFFVKRKKKRKKISKFLKTFPNNKFNHIKCKLLLKKKNCFLIKTGREVPKKIPKLS